MSCIFVKVHYSTPLYNYLLADHTTDALRKLLNSPSLAFRFDAGCPRPSSSIDISDKERVARSISLNYVVFSQKAELDEIRSGFDCLKFSELVQPFPSLLKAIVY